MTKERFKIVAAVYLLLRRGDEVLLLQRANTGYQDGNYSLIAGHIDGDELGIDAMIREAREEVGISLGRNDVKFVHVSHRLCREQAPAPERIDLFYEASNWEGEPVNMEPHKCSDLSWHRLDNLPTNIIPYVKEVLENISRGVNYSEYVEEPS